MSGKLMSFGHRRTEGFLNCCYVAISLIDRVIDHSTE